MGPTRFCMVLTVSFVTFSISSMWADHQKPLGNSPVRLKTLQELDANKNGFIEVAEWPDYRALFNRLDTNRDGRLDEREYFDRGDQVDRAQRFNQWDTDRNGVISGPEWRSDPALFHKLDRDADSVLSAAEFTAHDIDQRFRDFDKDRDGLISLREWTRDQAEFRRMDRNNDRTLTPDEYIARGDVASRAAQFTEWDKNRDGVLQGNEWTGPRALFHQLDRDANSVLSRQEYMDIEGVQAADRTGSIFADPVQPQRERRGTRVGSRVDPERNRRWRALDTDGDGVLSQDQWTGDQHWFDLLDRDNNGAVTSAEYLTPDFQAMFDELDDNRDGRVARAEWTGRLATFRQLDANADRSLTREELESFKQ